MYVLHVNNAEDIQYFCLVFSEENQAEVEEKRREEKGRGLRGIDHYVDIKTPDLKKKIQFILQISSQIRNGISMYRKANPLNSNPSRFGTRAVCFYSALIIPTSRDPSGFLHPCALGLFFLPNDARLQKPIFLR